jgi:uncharacterized RDD family membrane protein YckC
MHRATEGIYFVREDYAPFWLRLLVDLIDVVVVGVGCLAPLALASAPFWPSSWQGAVNHAALAACAVFAFCYFVLLKRSGPRTVGYRVGGVRIVDLDGQPASLSSLTLRLSFFMLGFWNWLLDLIWLSNDRHRQALRDKVAQTYVVKMRAQPAGRGRLVYQYYEILGYNFQFRDVETEDAQSRPRAGALRG